MFVIFWAALICGFVLRLLLPWLQILIPDHPNARSSHSQATPRGGGVVFVLLSSGSACFALLYGQSSSLSALFIFVVPLAVVGLLDDSLNLSASFRYSIQLLTASLILGVSPLARQLSDDLSWSPFFFLLVLCLLVISVTSIINFINFMDGLDGLVAGSMSVSISGISLMHYGSWPVLVLIGSLIGFLFLNWSPARVFMGDVGSTYLGAVFAGLILQASSWLDAFACLLMITPLLADACICVLRRLLAGQSVFQAHRLHLFQRLHQAGWSHSRVSLVYILATALLVCSFFIGDLFWLFGLSVVVVLLGFWLDQRFAVPFAAASKS